MNELTKEEMLKIDGGISFGWLAAGIAAGITFIIGIFSGYTNPNKCNN